MAETYSIHGETMTCKIIVRISEENTQKIKIQITATLLHADPFWL
jgi:hypothetical protein